MGSTADLLSLMVGWDRYKRLEPWTLFSRRSFEVANYNAIASKVVELCMTVLSHGTPTREEHIDLILDSIE